MVKGWYQFGRGEPETRRSGKGFSSALASCDQRKCSGSEPQPINATNTTSAIRIMTIMDATRGERHTSRGCYEVSPVKLTDKLVVAKALKELGLYLQIKGENAFKTRAYDIASERIEGLADDL